MANLCQPTVCIFKKVEGTRGKKNVFYIVECHNKHRTMNRVVLPAGKETVHVGQRLFELRKNEFEN